jgi:hypothetical protein
MEQQEEINPDEKSVDGQIDETLDDLYHLLDTAIDISENLHGYLTGQGFDEHGYLEDDEDYPNIQRCGQMEIGSLDIAKMAERLWYDIGRIDDMISRRKKGEL